MTEAAQHTPDNLPWEVDERREDACTIVPEGTHWPAEGIATLEYTGGDAENVISYIVLACNERPKLLAQRDALLVALEEARQCLQWLEGVIDDRHLGDVEAGIKGTQAAIAAVREES